MRTNVPGHDGEVIRPNRGDEDCGANIREVTEIAVAGGDIFVRADIEIESVDWDVPAIKRFINSEPRDWGLRPFKNGFESGKYFDIYEKWFGPKGELPYPMSPQVKAYLMKQIGK